VTQPLHNSQHIKKPRKHKNCIQTKAHAHPHTPLNTRSQKKTRWLISDTATHKPLHAKGGWFVCNSCFLGFYVLWSVQWLGHLLPPVSDLLQGFICVCTQVSGSVVSNWPLCDLFVDMCIVVLLSIIFTFLNFVCSWDTRRWIKSKNTIRLIYAYLWYY
jgi:hypothetical protein